MPHEPQPTVLRLTLEHQGKRYYSNMQLSSTQRLDLRVGEPIIPSEFLPAYEEAREAARRKLAAALLRAVAEQMIEHVIHLTREQG